MFVPGLKKKKTVFSLAYVFQRLRRLAPWSAIYTPVSLLLIDFARDLILELSKISDIAHVFGVQQAQLGIQNHVDVGQRMRNRSH